MKLEERDLRNLDSADKTHGKFGHLCSTLCGASMLRLIETLEDRTICDEHAYGCPCQAGGDVLPIHQNHLDAGEPEQDCDDCQESVAEMWHRFQAPY